MKNAIFVLALIVASGLFNSLRAQTPMYYKTGTGTAAQTIPLNQNSQKTQLLYAVSDFNSLPPNGNITKLYFRNSAAGSSGTFTDFQVSFLQNNDASIATNSYYTGLTLAMTTTSITVTANALAGGWFEIPLTAPYFVYDNTKSLIVEIQYSAKVGGISTTYTSSTGTKRVSGQVQTATTGTLSSTHNDFGMDILPTAACTSPPVAGTATSSVSAPVCAGTNVTLNLVGATFGSGQSYQWQSSPSIGGPYTNVGVPSFISSSLIISASSTLYYQAAVTCSGNTQYSVPVLVTVTPPFPAGVYTINSAAPASATNFQSFNAAVSALNCGIAGPVTFNVVPGNGPYNEQITIGAIQGASAVNRITFNGNGDTMQFAAVSGARHIIKLDGADFVTIKNLALISTSATYGWGVNLTEGADNDSIANCNIYMVNVTSTTQASSAGIVCSGSGSSVTSAGSASNNVIVGNTVSGAYQGIIINGTATSMNATNNMIINNTVQDFYADGIVLTNNDGATVAFNDVNRATRAAVTTFTGIEIGADCINVKVNGNKIHDTHTGATTQSGAAYGISLNGADATPATANRITNNIIYKFNSLTGAQYGLYNTGADGAYFMHNTVVLDNATSTAGITRGVYQTTAATDVKFINNIIYITRGGTGIKYNLYFNAATSTITSNNNVLYMNAPGGTNSIGYLGSAQATLANWQTTGYDLQSVDVDPAFTSIAAANFLPTNNTINNIGTYSGVTQDILGSARSVTVPDPGAYEMGIPVCPAPTGLASSNVTTVSADLAWDAVPGAVGFEYAVNTSATPPASGTATTANTYSPGSLLPSTVYYLHVRVNCSPGVYSPWATITFTTGCASVSTTITPAGPTTFCAGGSVALSVTAATGNTYEWRLDGNIIPGGTNSSVTASVGGNYTVTVTNGTCNATSAITAVTVNALPPGTIAATSSICISGSVNIDGPGGAGLTYQWKLGGVDIPGATNATYAATTAGNYTVQVSNGNCSVLSNINALTINNPQVTSTTGATRCGTGTVNLQATGSGTSVLNWYAAATGGSSLGTGSPFTTPSISATTTYYVGAGEGFTSANYTVGYSNSANYSFLTQSAGWGAMFTANTNCTLDSVGVYPTGTGTITLQILSTANAILFTGPTYNITGNGTQKVMVPIQAPLTPGSYKLGMSSTGVSNLGSQATGGSFAYPFVSPPLTITSGTQGSGPVAAVYYWFYDWKVSTQTGCESPRTAVVATVNPLPVSEITPSGTVDICQGSTTTLNANTGTGLTYQWKQGGTNITGATNATYTTGTAGTYSLTVSNGTCDSTSVAVTVNVNTPPTATITPAGPTTLCQGDSIVIYANTGTGFTYQWSNGGIAIPAATGDTLKVLAAGTYTVAVTNAGNCTSTSAIHTVTTHPLPVATITPAGGTTFCQGDSVVLNANTGTGLTWQWQLNNANIAAATTSTHVAYTAGSYLVMVNDGVCSNASASVVVTVNPLPVPVITLSGNVNMGTGTFATYQWNFNGTAIPGATNQNHTATQDGSYTVTVTDANGCSATSTATQITKTSITNVTWANDIAIYPNPTRDIVNISSPQQVNVSVSGIDGKEILSVKDAKRIDIGSFANGLYMIKVYDTEGRLVKVERLYKTAE